ncbi:MAG: AAA family ATPase [Flavobacteriaceae bacterium]|nr:AAA family ATPase [Flavobacteriaceae bacterium]
MIIKRSITKYLMFWKSKANRKPLIIRGARQVGKTTIIKEFSKTYKYQLILNLEKEEDREFFRNTDNVKLILQYLLLSRKLNDSCLSDTLLFIDEIQEYPKVISLLRYFYEEVSELHVIAAGSLLEFAMRRLQTFPVGRVEFMYLHPINFEEYLEAAGFSILLDDLKNIPTNPIAHRVLMNQFNRYATIGGMPEIIQQAVIDFKVSHLVLTYDSIWNSFLSDIEKYARNDTELKVIKLIMSTAPFLVDKRIKFQNFGPSNYRSREVGVAFRSIHQAKVIQLIYPSTEMKPPIILDFKKSPKMQFLDTGILNHILGITGQLSVLNDFSNDYRGFLIPHIFIQDFISIHHITHFLPSFWVRNKTQSSSELDLIVVVDGKLLPIKIKSGKTGRLRSLHQFIDHCDHHYGIRIYSGEFDVHKTKTPNGKPYVLMNLPYYLGTQLPKYARYFVENY